MKSVMLSASPWSLMRGMEQFILSGVLPQISSVEWKDNCAPHTTGDKIVLPQPFIGMSQIDLALWRYKCQHEVGHESAVNSRPHWKAVMTAKHKSHPDKLLWNIGNLLSDHIQERNCLGEWYGRDEVLLRGRELFMVKEVMPGLSKSPEGKFAQLFLYDSLKRKDWNPFMTTYPKLFDRDFFAKVEACGDWASLKNELDAFEMACKIRKLFDEPEEDEQDESPSGAGGKGSGGGDADGLLVATHKLGPAPDEGEPNPHTFLDDGTRNTCSGAKRITVRRPVGLNGRPI